MRVAIIGAGPSGLAAAYELAVRGIEVHVYEKEAHVGGLARSLDVLGEAVELGPHFVVNHDKTESEQAIFSFFEEEASPYDRRSRICMDGVYFDYPPRVLDILQKWGLGRSFFAFLSLVRHRGAPEEGPPNAYAYVRRALGQILCDAFFANYTEKLWGVPCDQIDESYARSLIGFEKLSLRNLLTKLRSTGNAQFHQACLHPKGGLGVVWTKMKDAIEAHGGRFHMQAAISSFALRGRRVCGLVTADGQEHLFDHVLSSAPDALMLRMLPHVPQALLDSLKGVRARKLALLYVKLSDADAVPDNTVYLYGRSVKAVRATNFNRFKGARGEGVVLMEYWLGPDEALCREPEALTRIGLADLRKAFGVEPAEVLGTHVVYLNAAYIVPDPSLAVIKAAVRAHLDAYEGLHRMGRGNQDLFNYGVVQAVRDGLASARGLVAARQAGEQEEGRLAA